VTPLLVAVALDALWRYWRRRPAAGADAAPVDVASADEPAEVTA
jgi:hypothetical protein